MKKTQIKNFELQQSAEVINTRQEEKLR